MKKLIIIIMAILFPELSFSQSNKEITNDTATSNMFLKVDEICGVPFGSSIKYVKKQLKKKYGSPQILNSGTCISYSNVMYSGIYFDVIIFQFQCDGNKSYLNDVIFIKESDNFETAEFYREQIYNKMSEKYTIFSSTDSHGNKAYYGGVSPLSNENGYQKAFQIDIMQFDLSDGVMKHPYTTRLRYGPFDYVKEDF